MISFFTTFDFSSFLDAMMTFAPILANSSAATFPMPALPPGG